MDRTISGNFRSPPPPPQQKSVFKITIIEICDVLHRPLLHKSWVTLSVKALGVITPVKCGKKKESLA